MSNITLWFGSIDRYAGKMNAYLSLISDEEISRSKSFKFPRDRISFIIRHGLLRQKLSELCQLDLRNIDIRTDPNGKPYLANQAGPSGVCFNISHSGDAFAFAFSWIGSIGIDIEIIKPIPDMQAIMDRHFTSAEKESILAIPSEQQTREFFKYWTRKEAVLKASGDGLSLPLEKVDTTVNPVTLGASEIKAEKDAGAKQYWVSDIIECPDGYRAAYSTLMKENHYHMIHDG